MQYKKYGTFGLMEWKASIKAGRATLHVHFTGGHDNEYGIIPATYSTSDPIIQHIIEHSGFFVDGKIKLIDSVDMGESPEEKEMKLRNERLKKEGEPIDTKNTKEVDLKEDRLTEVEVTCLDDAKDYLKENFGEKASLLRNKESIESLAQKHGVIFKYMNE